MANITSTSSTPFEVPPSSMRPSNATDDKLHEPHLIRRFFIGPMPEKVVSEEDTRKKRKSSYMPSPSVSSNQQDNRASQFIKEHDFSFFIQQGGKVEDWSDIQQESVRREMLRRWKESEWGKIWLRRDKAQRQLQQLARSPAARWVGQSFEVGNILGVNILKEPAKSIKSNRSLGPSPLPSPPFLSSSADVFHSALSSNPPSQIPNISITKCSTQPRTEQDNIPSRVSIGGSESAANSRTSLLAPTARLLKARSEGTLRPIAGVSASTRLKSDPIIDMRAKGKGRFVHYADSEPDSNVPAAPPREVLARRGSSVEGTSAGAVLDSAEQSKKSSMPTVVIDRMLVRVGECKGDPPTNFDESRSRVTGNLHYEDWQEFMVIWQKNRIELCKEHSFPANIFSSSKQIAHVIPLKSTQTKLSLFSFVDLTFCLTYPASPPSAESHLFNRGNSWSVYVFKVKARSRALDWVWRLWRYLGGSIPPYLEIHIPTLDTRIRIDIPDTQEENNYRLLNRDNLLALCFDTLAATGSWDTILEYQRKGHKALQLCWRSGINLDWVWLEDDVEGHARHWSVVCGLALKQSIASAHLELRLAEHHATHLRLKDILLEEPPALEGYLERIKANNAKQSIYLSIHSGNIFTLNPSNAHPPLPPGLETSHSENLEAEELREMEVARGALQIMDSSGVSDLRSILTVRRSIDKELRQTHNEKEPPEDEWHLLYSSDVEHFNEDDEDEGGDEGLAKASDKELTRLRRSFEMLLQNGHIIRFEAYSCRNAVEWIEKLRALLLYWKHRHRIDAREEMDLAQFSRPRLTPHLYAHYEGSDDFPPEAPVDTAAPVPALTALYNWCVIEGCRPIVKSDSLFARKGLYGNYQLVQVFLVAGTILQYRLKSGSAVNPMRRQKISLADAYVCSGYFAALTLPNGQYDPSAPPVPRRYQDGLETDDPDEDIMFMVWYRPQTTSSIHIKEGVKYMFDATATAVPKLSAKRKLAIFRTRSKLERDAWCWALNCEIERLVRSQKERESRLRDPQRPIALANNGVASRSLS